MFLPPGNLQVHVHIIIEPYVVVNDVQVQQTKEKKKKKKSKKRKKKHKKKKDSSDSGSSDSDSDSEERKRKKLKKVGPWGADVIPVHIISTCDRMNFTFPQLKLQHSAFLFVMFVR